MGVCGRAGENDVFIRFGEDPEGNLGEDRERGRRQLQLGGIPKPTWTIQGDDGFVYTANPWGSFRANGGAVRHDRETSRSGVPDGYDSELSAWSRRSARPAWLDSGMVFRGGGWFDNAQALPLGEP